MNADDLPDKPAVVMYTQALCGYCAAARELFDAKGVACEEISVTLDADQRRAMVGRAGRSTVPQIFVGDRHIGGYDDLAALEREGKLDEILGLTEKQ